MLILAAKEFARSKFTAGAILYAISMFHRPGVDSAASLLGGLTILCSGGIHGIYFYEARLRGRSRFVV